MNSIVIIAIVIVAWGGIVGLMLLGWRNRGRRQQDVIGAFPDVPTDPGALLLGPDTGVYVGSTVAPSWQDRVAVGDYGDRASAEFSNFELGILISRSGANPIWIPRESITAIRTERGLAGKVMTADGVLVIRWTLPSGTEIDSGLRGDNKLRYPEWTALDPRAAEVPGATPTESDIPTTGDAAVPTADETPKDDH